MSESKFVGIIEGVVLGHGVRPNKDQSKAGYPFLRVRHGAGLDEDTDNISHAAGAVIPPDGQTVKMKVAARSSQWGLRLEMVSWEKVKV